jgi:acetyl-CoA acyltransferase
MQREAIKGLMKKTGIRGDDVDYVSTGTVIQEVFTSNIARESAMAAGIPLSTPAHTVTLACISSNVAMATGVDKIKTGQVRTAQHRAALDVWLLF